MTVVGGSIGDLMVEDEMANKGPLDNGWRNKMKTRGGKMHRIVEMFHKLRDLQPSWLEGKRDQLIEHDGELFFSLCPFIWWLDTAKKCNKGVTRHKYSRKPKLPKLDDRTTF